MSVTSCAAKLKCTSLKPHDSHARYEALKIKLDYAIIIMHNML